MALVTKVFSINITPGEMPPTIHVSEYDVGRAYNVTFIGENGNAFEIPTGTTATVEGTLNGTIGFTTSATISNNQISFALTESMTAYSGKAWCKIKLTLNDEPIQTCAFILAVDRAGVEAETVIGAPGFEGQIRDAVDDWLESDDGIADAVQDAVDEYASEHGIVISNGFVTPEDYGARGDGTTDDTTAIQLAVDSGRNVMFGYSKTYKCGQINVAKNIEIDCRWAEFVCTSETLFNCTGEVDESVAGADYVANTPYALLNNDKYTGFALLRSTDNVITMRDYYYGGFVTLFAEGVCNDCRPIGFTGVTVDKITPITCKIKNVGNVVFTENVSGNNKNTVVKCTYGLDCDFDGFDVDGDYYSTVSIKKSYRCKAKNVNGYLTYTGALPNYYAISTDDSSECVAEDCYLTSDFWHCYDVGGNYLCFNNVARNCNFFAGRGAVAYNNHANAIDSVIENCVINNVAIGAGGIVRNSRIVEHKVSKDGTDIQCRITMCPTNVAGINTLTVDNVIFDYENADSTADRGVFVRCSAYTTGNHFILDGLNVSHMSTVHDADLVDYPEIRIIPTTTLGDFTLAGDIILDDVVGCFYFHETNDYPNIIFSGDRKALIRNMRRVRADGQGLFRLGTSSGHRFPSIVEVRDSVVWQINGKFTKLLMFNVSSTHYVVGSFVATSLIGDNVSRLSSNANLLANLTNARVTNMRYSDTSLWTYLYISNGAGNYGVLGSGGVVNTALS